ncbi:Tether containing UBX domain for GLUT4 [Rhizoclosmatium sp. JEL0117]|nr:Tether containing UBX domain for GLUT4 [Rhizoclosmatium sp. JEL0117]
MASQFTIEVEGTFPLKKFVIKTTPAMALNDVLKTAVEKAGANTNSTYILKHGKTVLDLSLSVRFANLPAGAKLSLCPSSTSASTPTSSSKPPTAPSTSKQTLFPSTVQPQQTTPQTTQITIALQIQEGPRIIQKFPPQTTLWQLLKHTETTDPACPPLTRHLLPPPTTPTSSNLPKPLQAISDASKKLMQSQQPLVYAFPLLILSNKEYGSFQLLKETTLESVGLRGGGNALVRLLWKVDGSVGWEDVKSEVEAVWEPVSVVAAPTPSARPPPAIVVQKEETVAAAMEVDAPQKTEAESVKVEDETVELASGEFDRTIKIFAAPPADIDGPMNIQLPDTFFQLSPTELKLAYLSSKSKSKALTDAPLMTKSMRDREDELRQKKWPKTMIRIRFPDRTTVQAAFLSTEPVSAVYALMREVLNTPERAFTLYTTPPLLNLAGKKELTFWKAGLAPATLVYFKWDDGGDVVGVLKGEWQAKMEEFPVPPPVEVGNVPEISPSADSQDVDMDGGVDAAIPAREEYRQSEAMPEKKVPKWFKIGKK